MGASKIFFSFFFLLFSVMLLSNIYVMANDCSISANYFCRPYVLVPRFPFRIKDQQPKSCGYPGFNLTCKPVSAVGCRTVLELPVSGEFDVKEIDYVKQEIRLQDPHSCLPNRLLDLNLSGTPFKSVYYQNYTFLNCTYQLFSDSIFEHYIPCLSRGGYYILATSSMTPVQSFHRYCEVIKTVLVPVQFPVGNELSYLNFQSITLSWDKPDCRYCEARNQECRLRNENSHETKCFRKGPAAGAISSTIIGIGLPALLGIICCIAFCTRVCSDDENQPSNVELSNAISPQPIIPVISLNASAIDSYPKIVLGESWRLPKPDDNICPICLSEYLPKETLKIIPECNHNFHADCIDQWLHTKMTCPVCRNSPT